MGSGEGCLIPWVPWLCPPPCTEWVLGWGGGWSPWRGGGGAGHRGKGVLEAACGLRVLSVWGRVLLLLEERGAPWPGPGGEKAVGPP